MPDDTTEEFAAYADEARDWANVTLPTALEGWPEFTTAPTIDEDVRAILVERLADIPTGIDGLECRIPDRRHREMIAAVALSVRWEDHAVTVARLAQSEARAEQATALLRDLVDADDCWFDHHGGCQAHGYLSLEPGERCPQAEAKELIGRGDGKETTDA